jgi:putative thiamine transport system permease protein
VIRSRAHAGVRRAFAICAAALFALPLVAALAIAMIEGGRVDAWQRLTADPQVPPALMLSVGTALASTLVALLLALVLATHLYGSRAWRLFGRTLGPMLAVPHAAFAIGFALLVMPAGLIARLIAPIVGWDAPPHWPTVHDPWGIGLVAVLVLKETPFLLWNLTALLARPDVDAAVHRQLAIGRTLGYSAEQVWWRVVWPQWLPRVAWPLAAVLAYGLTVVDLALIIGPTSPPTLAVLAWQALLDASATRNAEGAAAAVALVLTLLALVALGAGLMKGWKSIVAVRARRGERAVRRPLVARFVRRAAIALPGLYLVVVAVLAATSLVGVWRFPALLPQLWTGHAWQQVLVAPRALLDTAVLALAAATTSLVLALAWLEGAPRAWHVRGLPMVMLPLVVPGILLASGAYQVALMAHVDGTPSGLLWVHTLVVLPYVVIALAPAWHSFDRRFEATALALGRSRAAFWWRIKLPMLAAPVAAAFAVGFAVSVAQYLPTLLVGAGRFATVTTEAVTLAAGGQRQAAAAWAFAQALLPALGFMLAHAYGLRHAQAFAAAPR